MDTIPTNQRLKRVINGRTDLGLQELLFHYGRYLLIASSRKGSNPANLQGLWNKHINAPWNADYHLNINLQMTYWAAWSANVGEAAAPLVDFLEGLAAAGAKTAREWYGAPGWVAHGYTDLWRDARALGENKWALCATCGAYGESFKQISFRKLPPVLCLHVKRFEHFPGAGQARKVTSRLQFPLDYLDVGPYMASSVLAQRYHSHGLEEAAGKLRREEGEAASKYKLAAVVSHLGTMAGGHYVVYVCRGAKWFRCDDASIAEVDEAVVRNCEAYLLFYKRRDVQEPPAPPLNLVNDSIAPDPFAAPTAGAWGDSSDDDTC